VVVQFSEEVTGWDGNAATLRRVSNGAVVPVTKSYAGSQLTLDPNAPLEPGVVYQVSLGSGIKAASDGRSLKSTSFRFTTLAGEPPTVVSTSPSDGDTGVGVGTNVAVHFSDQITGFGGASATLTRVSDGSEIPVTKAFSAVNNNRLLLNPYGGTADLLEPGTQYRVTLTARFPPTEPQGSASGPT
jgi:hypothetical protein